MRKRPRREVGQRNTHQRISTKTSDNMDNFNIFMVFAFFMSTFFVFEGFLHLDISLFQLFQLYCLVLGIGFLIPIKLYRKKLTMSYYEYVIFNILTFSTILLVILFKINNSFKGPEYVETYAIESYEQTEYNTMYFLENNEYEDKEYLRSIDQYDEIEVKGNSSLSLYFSDGFLGIRIVEKKVLH